ncbi:MAG: Crp/Fnr family transcriptional regulator [Bacteroidota bacterium]
MEQIRNSIQQMIKASDEELDDFLKNCFIKTFKKKSILSAPNTIPNEIFYIKSGILRLVIVDRKGTEHTISFGIENQFIADYANFLQKKPSIYSLQALEESEIVVLPRTAIEWGYKNLKQGDRLGRLIAEYYFIYHDNRIKDMYFRSPRERYDMMNNIFPNIHNRVPQHMIASFIGITSVHLSRLKKERRLKT